MRQVVWSYPHEHEYRLMKDVNEDKIYAIFRDEICILKGLWLANDPNDSVKHESIKQEFRWIPLRTRDGGYLKFTNLIAAINWAINEKFKVLEFENEVEFMDYAFCELIPCELLPDKENKEEDKLSTYGSAYKSQ